MGAVTGIEPTEYFIQRMQEDTFHMTPVEGAALHHAKEVIHIDIPRLDRARLSTRGGGGHRSGQ
jgi:hypothetical protein